MKKKNCRYENQKEVTSAEVNVIKLVE